MALRCLLFSSDEGTAVPICQALAGLGIEAEYCPIAVEAVAKITTQSFQIVIVDWDNQPEAGLLLNTARERKAAERPLTLAIVSNDTNVSQALQAGANSILRKPIQPNQVRETLTTARDLLRSRLDSVAPPAQAAAAAAGVSSGGPVVPQPANNDPDTKKTLRAGEFLQPVTGPGAQFDTESETKNSFGQVAASEIDALKDLEPMAASVETKGVVPESAPPGPSEPRGLAWYLNARGSSLPGLTSEPPGPAKAELLTYDKTPSHDEPSPPGGTLIAGRDSSGSPESHKENEQKTEAALFAYMSGESSEDSEQVKGNVRPGLRKALVLIALVAVCGVIYVTVPRSLWRQKGRLILSYIVHTGHNWLNPQTPTPAQAPASHENFGRAGDEYKLPVAENIPDATTDPSQIRVLPVLDPTAKVDPNAKQPNAGGDNAEQVPAGTTPGGANPGDQPQPPPVQVQENLPVQQAPANTLATADQPVSALPQPPLTIAGGEPAHPDAQPVRTAVIPPQRTTVQPVPQKTSSPHPASTSSPAAIPSSLKSQMASMTPDASGNKPPEAALPSIEPVQLPEATARSLLLQQPELVYPEAAKGQKGTVVLQVLIARDGTVQDAKFLQGSLAFARTAIDAVKQWRFRPFTMNGRPASAQTLLTLNFKPGT
jgi:protein TonB